MRRRDGQRGQTTTEYLMISGLMTTMAIYILQRMQEPFRQRLQEILDPNYRRELDVTQDGLRELEDRVDDLENAHVELEARGVPS